MRKIVYCHLINSNKFPTWGANIEIYQIGDLSVFKNSSRNNFTIFDNTIDSIYQLFKKNKLYKNND